MQILPLHTIETILPGTFAEVEISGEKYILCNVAGEFHCISSVCPHAGGRLAEGSFDGIKITCPWHGWEFDCRSGVCTTRTDKRLTKFPVIVEAGIIAIELPQHEGVGANQCCIEQK